ncbi:hypothetical protein ACP275_06G151600 [Erythranthe tilingii]
MKDSDILLAMKGIYVHREDTESDEKEFKREINDIIIRLNRLLLDMEEEPDKELAEKLKSRINKILGHLNKLLLDDSGSDSESEPEPEYEPESDSEFDKFLEVERELEREIEPIEELSLETEDPYRLKRPKTRGGLQFPCVVTNCCMIHY